ncbi:MAG: hypothetical protein ACREVG_05945 [Burkholderiales bacterium]
MMRPRIVHCSMFLLLMLAGCAGTRPDGEVARQAMALQASVPAAIDCSMVAGKPFEMMALPVGPVADSRAPVGPVLNVRLHALGVVSPLVRPGRKEKPDARFAGLVPFRVEEGGTYTVLVASLAWADLVEANPTRLAESRGFKWVEACGKRFKSGLYALEPGRDYVVQLWDSPDRDLTLMVRRLR